VQSCCACIAQVVGHACEAVSFLRSIVATIASAIVFVRFGFRHVALYSTIIALEQSRALLPLYQVIQLMILL